ncbi:MAG: hypothetical protein Phog2KO_35310 [Phototrophicaceae bacterium]
MTFVLQMLNYERRYRDDILSLIFHSRHTHAHLDWYKAGQWLDLADNHLQLAFDHHTLVGVLGFSEGLNGSVWLRLAIVAQGYDPALILSFLWEQLRVTLLNSGLDTAAVLAVNPWIENYLPALGFHYHEDVITMHRAPQDLPLEPQSNVSLKSGYLEDLGSIIEVDHAAFSPPWQMNSTDIRLSQRQAASCKLAVLDNQVIGYEVATRHHTSGHLARLAVHPNFQGQGVGQVMLHSLLARFIKRGVNGMTVNTQISNMPSRRLYERYGFIRNGFDLPVWMCTL